MIPAQTGDPAAGGHGARAARTKRSGVFLCASAAVVAAALSTASAALAARPPTFKEREAITAALPAFMRTTPVECLWLEVRVSSRDRRYAWVGGLYLNTMTPGSRCLRYGSNGFYVLKKAPHWKIIFNGSVDPPCSLGVPRDLALCQ